MTQPIEESEPYPSTVEDEAARQLQICNACRYCEGFCAVFPAMTRRLDFPSADIHYLASLCHNCGACLHACQYAPPHEFRINIPRVMAQTRLKTYEEFAWPAALGAAYRRNGLAVAGATAAALALFLVLALATTGSLSRAASDADFYAVFPHALLVAIFGVVSVMAVLVMTISAARFWRQVGQPAGPGQSVPAALEATHDALTLRYLDGGHGEGCNEADDAFTLSRRRLHHLTFWGFMFCFASTCVATVYHYALGLHAPYALTSLPVLLGTAGGIALLVGATGLLWLNVRRDPQHGDPQQRPMDRGFAALLIGSSLTGLVLLALRATAAMPLLLAIHLGIVLALLALLPYGKFAHAIYRPAALLKYAIERRQPNRLQLGTD